MVAVAVEGLVISGDGRWVVRIRGGGGRVVVVVGVCEQVEERAKSISEGMVGLFLGTFWGVNKRLRPGTLVVAVLHGGCSGRL